jgi:hypothetical protein
MIWIAFAIVAVLLFSLSFTKFEIREDIEIDATPEQVWQTIIDFPNYQHWNTQLFFLGGEVKPHGKLHLRLAVQGTSPYEFKPTISHWRDQQTFAWIAVTGFPRIFDGEHFFELQAVGHGKTLVINRETYRGVLSLLMRNLPMMKDAPKGFVKMNLELKARVERSSLR